MTTHLLETVWRNADPLAAGSDLAGIVRRVHSATGSGKQRVIVRKKAAPRQQPGSDFVEALAHGLAVLECWQGSDVWLTNSELSERSGLTRVTVSRLTSVLVDLGYLAREGRRGRLRLTASTLALGFGNAFSTLPISTAQAELGKLAHELDVYAALGIRRIDKVQVLENVVSPSNPDAVVMDVGGLLPMCRSASGLAAMSALPDREASPLIARLQSRYGARWNPLERQLIRTKQEYSRNGYCTSVAVLSRDVGAVAIPIMPAGTNDIFVLACGMPAQEFCPERIQRSIAPRMLRAAEELTAALST